MKSKSLKEWLNWRYKQHGSGKFRALPTTYIIARVGDYFLKTERERIARETAKASGHELKARAEITDYQYKKNKNHRIKVNGKSFTLIPLKRDFPLDELPEK